MFFQIMEITHHGENGRNVRERAEEERGHDFDHVPIPSRPTVASHAYNKILGTGKRSVHVIQTSVAQVTEIIKSFDYCKF